MQTAECKCSEKEKSKFFAQHARKKKGKLRTGIYAYQITHLLPHTSPASLDIGFQSSGQFSNGLYMVIVSGGGGELQFQYTSTISHCPFVGFH